jgi:hypothetical protein
MADSPRDTDFSSSHPYQPPAGGDGVLRPLGRGRFPGGLVVTGGTMLVLGTLLIQPGARLGAGPGADSPQCITQARGAATLSRDQLKALIAIEPQTPRATLRQLLGEPHCGLGVGQGAADGPVDRDAYPLEFDPATWLVVEYDGDRYVGYDFSFR